MRRRRRRFECLAATVVLAVVACAGEPPRAPPGTCLSCHPSGHVAPEWARSPHKELACAECHTATSAEDLARLSAVAGRLPHGAVDEGRCADCHARPERTSRPGKTRGHEVHVGKAKIGCTRCHGESTRGVATAMNAPTASSGASPARGAALASGGRGATATCRTCHRAASDAVHAGGGKVDCVSCHDFFEGTKGHGSARAACAGCHAEKKPVAFAATSHEKLDCAECHRPHAALPLGGVPDRRVACARCHPSPERETSRVLAIAASEPPEQPEAGVSIASAWPSATPRTLGQAHGQCRTCHSVSERAAIYRSAQTQIQIGKKITEPRGRRS